MQDKKQNEKKNPRRYRVARRPPRRETSRRRELLAQICQFAMTNQTPTGSLRRTSRRLDLRGGAKLEQLLLRHDISNASRLRNVTTRSDVLNTTDRSTVRFWMAGGLLS